jgi:hypothetical protein
MASLGGYSLKNVKEFPGHDFPGLSATLCYNKKAIAEFYDGGYGGDPEIQCSEEDRARVHNDYKLLIHKFSSSSDIVEDLALFANTGYMAVQGIIELLFALNRFAKEAIKLSKKCPPNTYYIIYMEGRHSISTATGYATYQRAELVTFEHFKKNNSGEPMTYLAILTGPFTWDLSLDDYVALRTVEVK